MTVTKILVPIVVVLAIILTLQLTGVFRLSSSKVPATPTSASKPQVQQPEVIPQTPSEELEPDPIVPGVGLAGIKLDDTEHSVTDLLGQPSQPTFPVTTTGDKVLYYATLYDFNGIHLCVYTHPQGRTVLGIRLIDANFNKEGYIPHVRNIGIGSTVAELISSFGQPLSTDSHITCPSTLGSSAATSYVYRGITFCTCDANKIIYWIDIPDSNFLP
jgi:hypothetical protein